jgi:acetyltransferase-like isoleucine patch superfamily enzyme
VKQILKLISVLLPWDVRRSILEKQFGYEIHPSAKIGLAWVFPKRLVMEQGSRIDHLTVCKNIDLLHLKAESFVGRGNWITGYPGGLSPHFVHQPDRQPQLILSEHSSITHRHLIDCTNSVTIGKFTTVAGFQSQIVTHWIDIEHCRQTSAPISIGDYCFVGTNSVLIGGSALPDFCVLGAKSLLNKPFSETHQLYGGVPARAIQALSPDCKYFHRTEGFVV